MAVIIGDEILLSYGQNLKDIGAIMAVSLLNNGASDALVLRIEGTLTRKDGGWTVPVTWSVFFEPKEIGDGDNIKRWWSFAGTVSPVIASSRKASTTWIYFLAYPLPGPLTASSYDLTLSLVIGPKNRTAAPWTGSFSLDREQIAYLEENCVASTNDVAPDTTRVRLEGTTSGVRRDLPPPHVFEEPAD
ncbi:MAG: hypothetical protein ACLPQY_23370 [Streptosporangiaceae bacterium]